MCKFGVSVIWNWVLDGLGNTSAAKAAVDGWQRMTRREAAPLQSKFQKSSAPSKTKPKTRVLQKSANTQTRGPGGCLLSLHRQKKRLLECFRDPAQEAGGVGAVDEAMVVGERERQNEPRLELSIDPFRLGARTRESKNRHFRMVDDGRKAYAANPTQISDGEGAAFHLCRRDLLLPGFF